MCRPTTCRTCGKTTWAGCGRHVDEVMAKVPAGQRCTCAPGASRQSGGGLGRLFGR